MANKYEAYESQLERFNNRYKVNFSFEKYDKQKLDKKNLAPAVGNVDGLSKENTKYRNALLGIYKQCVDNVIKMNYKSFDSARLIEDFENLMNGYREYCNDNGKTPPEANGGWKKGTDIIGDMSTTLSTINPVRNDYLRGEYLAGNLRIRDMKADVMQRTGKNGMNNLSVEDLGVVSAYRDMLAEVVANRPVWWKVLNYFGKSSAEQKALKALTFIVNVNSENAISADDAMGESPIPDLQNELNTSAQKITEKDLAKAMAVNNNRVKEDMGFLAENNNVKEVSPKIEENKILEKNNVMEV